MGSINNNVSSLNSISQLGRTENQLKLISARLASGSRINQAFEDAAGLQISDNLRADIKILGQARRNANTGLGVSNIADGALTEASQLLNRASEIATQAASGTTSDAGRQALNDEFQEIVSQLDGLGANTTFDGQSVFGSDYNIKTGEGASQAVNLSVDALSSGDLGLGGLDLTSASNASDALGALSGAVESVSASRGRIGAVQQRLTSTIDSISVASENIQAAESQIRDADIANEVVNLTKLQILSKTGTSSVAQSNLQAQNVLSILNS